MDLQQLLHPAQVGKVTRGDLVQSFNFLWGVMREKASCTENSLARFSINSAFVDSFPRIAQKGISPSHTEHERHLFSQMGNDVGMASHQSCTLHQFVNFSDSRISWKRQ
jgi:hypothetical protein